MPKKLRYLTLIGANAKSERPAAGQLNVRWRRVRKIAKRPKPLALAEPCGHALSCVETAK